MHEAASFLMSDNSFYQLQCLSKFQRHSNQERSKAFLADPSLNARTNETLFPLTKNADLLCDEELTSIFQKVNLRLRCMSRTIITNDL